MRRRGSQCSSDHYMRHLMAPSSCGSGSATSFNTCAQINISFDGMLLLARAYGTVK